MHDIREIINPLHSELNLPETIFWKLGVGVGGSTYLSDWWFDYYVLEAVVRFYCLEVLMKYRDLFLIVPTWWTGGGDRRLQTKYRRLDKSLQVRAQKRLHEDSISFHHLRGAVEGKAVESVDQIFVKDVQVLHLLHWCVNQRRTVWHSCQGHFQQLPARKKAILINRSKRKNRFHLQVIATITQRNWGRVWSWLILYTITVENFITARSQNGPEKWFRKINFKQHSVIGDLYQILFATKQYQHSSNTARSLH